MTAFSLCAEFDLFTEKTQFLSHFSLSGFNFSVLGSNPKISICNNENERGLKFPNNGLEIVLPVSVTTVNIRIGTFGGSVDISAVDSAGSIVRKKTVSEQKYFVNIRLAAPEIASLILSGGKDEAVVVNTCISVFSC